MVLSALHFFPPFDPAPQGSGPAGRDFCLAVRPAVHKNKNFRVAAPRSGGGIRGGGALGMMELTFSGAPPHAPAKIRLRNQWWVLIALAVMAAAIHSGRLWYLNFVHVFSGLLWTGTDLFMGFMLGPILRRLDLDTRRAVIVRLMPRMLFYMPTLAIITTTAGFFMAKQLGFLAVPYPQYWWMIAVYVIVAVLTVQGFGLLLPTNLRVYFEMQKERPDGDKIARWMRTYVRAVAFQGALQVAIIVIMSRLATGM